uniref:Sulfotransferase n=1 Tax=Oryzias sinensis TaxID=183150 RepID=A0A8C7WS83_9TELE
MPPSNRKKSQNCVVKYYSAMTDPFFQDLRGSIEKVGVFLQCSLQEEELSSCVEHSRFSSMKDNKMINYSLVPEEIIDHNKGSFMRKGGLSWTFGLTVFFQMFSKLRERKKND